MGELTCLKKCPEATPHLCGRQQAGHGGSLVLGGGRVYQVYGEMASGWLIGYQGYQQRGLPVTVSLISCHGGDVLIQRVEQSLAGMGASM